MQRLSIKRKILALIRQRAYLANLRIKRYRQWFKRNLRFPIHIGIDKYRKCKILYTWTTLAKLNGKKTIANWNEFEMPTFSIQSLPSATYCNLPIGSILLRHLYGVLRSPPHHQFIKCERAIGEGLCCWKLNQGGFIRHPRQKNSTHVEEHVKAYEPTTVSWKRSTGLPRTQAVADLAIHRCRDRDLPRLYPMGFPIGSGKWRSTERACSDDRRHYRHPLFRHCHQQPEAICRLVLSILVPQWPVVERGEPQPLAHHAAH